MSLKRMKAYNMTLTLALSEGKAISSFTKFIKTGFKVVKISCDSPSPN